MNHVRTYIATALALSLATPALAQEATQPDRPGMGRGMMMGMDRCEPGMGMMCMMGQGMAMREQMAIERTERHLAALKAELKITEAQTKAWDAYAAAVTAAAKEMIERRRAMLEKLPSATLPERLDLHEQMLVSHLERLRKTKEVATALYGELTDDQKKIADRSFMGMGLGPMRRMR